MAHRGLAPRHPPSVRAQNSAPTAVGCRGAIRKMVRHPHRRARRADRECQFPPQFSPLWKPPFPDPPSKLESTKGGKTAGGTGTAAVMARLGKPQGPSPPAEPRAAALRVPGPLRRLSPLLLGPEGPGALVGQGRARFLTPPQPFKEFASSPMFSGSSLSPPCAFSPPRGRARRFCGGARPRAEERLQNNDGEIPIPPWETRVLSGCRKKSGQRDHPFKPAHSGKPPQPIMPPAN